MLARQDVATERVTLRYPTLSDHMYGTSLGWRTRHAINSSTRTYGGQTRSGQNCTRVSPRDGRSPRALSKCRADLF